MGRALDRIVSLWAMAGGLILLAIVVVTSTNVGSFLLDRIAASWGGSVPGLPGYEEFVALAISAAGLMFFPYCQLKRGHVLVELFTSRLPTSGRNALDRFWLVVTAGLALFLAYWMVFGMFDSRRDSAIGPVLGWYDWPFYAPGIISLVLWALVALTQAFARHPDAAGAQHG